MSVLIYILNFLLLGGWVYAIYKSNKDHSLKPYFFPFLAIKLLAGIALGLVFMLHYKVGDTLKYFEEGSSYADVGTKDLWLYIKALFNDDLSPFKSIYYHQPRALLMTKITSIFALISGKNYWITSLYFSVFSFFGAWALADRLLKLFKNKTAVILSLFLFPSILFWTSGISKESLAYGLMAVAIAYFIDLFFGFRKPGLKNTILFVFCLFILWEIKYYYAGLLVLSMAAVWVTSIITRNTERTKKSWMIQLAVFTASYVLLAVLVSFAHPNFNLDRVGQVIVKNYSAFVQKSEPSEYIHFDDLENSWPSLIRHAPLAMVSGIFRPWPTDGKGLLSVLAQAEHVMLILLVVAAFFKMPKPANKHRLLVLATLTYCLLLATFLALSAPNFGTLVRYKTGFTPLLLLVVTVRNPLIKKLNHWLFKE